MCKPRQSSFLLLQWLCSLNGYVLIMFIFSLWLCSFNDYVLLMITCSLLCHFGGLFIMMQDLCNNFWHVWMFAADDLECWSIGIILHICCGFWRFGWFASLCTAEPLVFGLAYAVYSWVILTLLEEEQRGLWSDFSLSVMSRPLHLATGRCKYLFWPGGARAFQTLCLFFTTSEGLLGSGVTV